MANLQLLSNAASPVTLVGVNVTPMTSYDYDVKNNSVTSAAAANDIIFTPIYDLNQVNPNTNRVNFQKITNAASADVMTIQMSNDGVNWYTAPLYNGGTGGGIATSATSAAELSLVGLPAMRYIRGAVQLITNAMAARTSMRISMSFLRY